MGAVNAVFLVEHSSREHKHCGRIGQSNTWASTDSYRPHRHSSAIHILKPGIRKRLMLPELPSTLTLWWHGSVYINPSSLPAPKASSFGSTSAFVSAPQGNTVAQVDLFPHLTLPPTTTNVPFDCMSRRDLCWIKATTWLLASQRSRAPLTPQVRPLLHG